MWVWVGFGLPGWGFVREPAVTGWRRLVCLRIRHVRSVGRVAHLIPPEPLFLCIQAGDTAARELRNALRLLCLRPTSGNLINRRQT